MEVQLRIDRRAAKIRRPGVKAIRLPNDEDAIDKLLELIGHLATTHPPEQTLRSFLQSLWNSSRFRDACEQRFPSIDFGVKQTRRANTVRVTAVSFDTLPAYDGALVSCTEEPF